MILITGGAGYIGSHMNKYLAKKDIKTVVFDNLSTGRRDFVKWGEFILGDLSDKKQLDLVFDKYEIEEIIHFAASIVVPESTEKPLDYYSNNTSNTINLLKFALEHKVKRFVFSSTAAVYGNPEKVPISEDSPLNPINPYGASKFMDERIIADTAKANPDFKYVIFRYFNAAGGSEDGEIGCISKTLLIPQVIEAAFGRKDSIQITGTDFDTKDGTGIRDYVHVNDLADAHFKALKYLKDGGESGVFNLGSQKGYSVREVINMVKKVTGKDFKVVEVERRPGDPAELIADSTKAGKLLKWETKYDLEEIIKTATKFENRAD